MPTTPAQIEAQIKLVFPQNTFLRVEDISDGQGSKFQLVLVSAEFEGKALLERHRAVYDGLKPVMPDIHAIVLKTWTPAQFESKKGELGLA